MEEPDSSFDLNMDILGSFPDFMDSHSLTDLQLDMESVDNKDSFMNMLNIPDMLNHEFDHLSNLPLGNDDIELDNITEDFDVSDLPDTCMAECEELVSPKVVECKVLETPAKPSSPSIDAFATLQKLWPNKEDILRDVKPKSQHKNSSFSSRLLARGKNMALLSSKNNSAKKSTTKLMDMDGDSSEEVDIETVDDELNEKSGAEILSIKLGGSSSGGSNCDAARLREVIPKKQRPPLTVPTPKVDAKPVPKCDIQESNVDVMDSPKITEKVTTEVATTVMPIVKPTEITKEKAEMSIEKANFIKKRESLLSKLPLGAKIKPKLKDPLPDLSVVKKIRQATQLPRTSILLPFPENPLNKPLKNGKSNSNKNLIPPIIAGLPVPLPPLSTPKKLSKPVPNLPLLKLSSPTISSSQSPVDPFRVISKDSSLTFGNTLKNSPSPLSSQNTPNQTSSQMSMLKVNRVSSSSTTTKPPQLDTKDTLSSGQPSPVSILPSGNDGGNHLLQPLFSVLKNSLGNNNGKDTSVELSQPLILELTKLLPKIFNPGFEHNYCSNAEVKKESDDNSPSVIDPPLLKVKKEETGDDDDEDVVIIKCEKGPTQLKKGMNNNPVRPSTEPLEKSLSSRVRKEGGKITTLWHQDVLLNELRSMKQQKRKESNSLSSSQRSKRHRSSCSPSTSSSSLSVNCYSPSSPHSSRSSRRSRTNRKTGNNRRRRRSSFDRDSSKSRSPSSHRKSYSRSRSPSWNRSKKTWKRSKSGSYSRSRSRSWSRSRDGYKKSQSNRNERKRSRSPVWASNSYKAGPAEKMRQIEEKRVLFVGNIPNGTTKKDLYDRFCKFGKIIEISVHFREVRENYGFVTFAYRCDACEALEHGNEDPQLPRLDLRYGCGKQSKPRYCDYDSQAMNELPKPPKLDFDSLLQTTRAQLCGRKPC